MKHTLFISDLHLNPNQPQLTAALGKLSHMQLAAQASAIYILGDFFALWAGDDDHNEFNKQIKTTLKDLAKQTTVYLMPGNRDFLLGTKFAREANCTLLSDPTKIYLYGQPTLLSHGDILCTNDLIAVIFRRVSQNKLAKKIFLSFPLKFRLRLATALHRYSTHQKKTKTGLMMDVNQKKIESLMEKRGVSQLIHGHTHKPHHYTFMINDQTIRRIVLASWDTSPNVLIYYENRNWETRPL